MREEKQASAVRERPTIALALSTEHTYISWSRHTPWLAWSRVALISQQGPCLDPVVSLAVSFDCIIRLQTHHATSRSCL
jgi:hypothetical protein